MAAPGIPSPGSTPGTATGIPATPGFQHPFVTPSPYYNNSIASTGWTSKPAVSCFINPFLRFFGMVSSFIVIFSLVTGNDKSSGAESFRSSAEFRFDILDFALWVFLFMLIFSGLSLDRCWVLVKNLFFVFIFDFLLGLPQRKPGSCKNWIFVCLSLIAFLD